MQNGKNNWRWKLKGCAQKNEYEKNRNEKPVDYLLTMFEPVIKELA